MKKIYKLLIIYDIDEEECEVLRETVDIVNDCNSEDEVLTEEDYEDKEVRDILIKSQIMGDA